MGKDNGGPAFPFNPGEQNLQPCYGMTLRDYFAAAALNGMLSRDAYQGGWCPNKKSPEMDGVTRVAKFAYEYADEMLSRRRGEEGT